MCRLRSPEKFNPQAGRKKLSQRGDFAREGPSPIFRWKRFRPSNLKRKANSSGSVLANKSSGTDNIQSLGSTGKDAGSIRRIASGNPRRKTSNCTLETTNLFDKEERPLKRLRRASSNGWRNTRHRMSQVEGLHGSMHRSPGVVLGSGVIKPPQDVQ